MKYRLLIFALLFTQPLFSQPDSSTFLENYLSSNVAISSLNTSTNLDACSDINVLKTQKSKIPYKSVSYFLDSGKRNYSLNQKGKYHLAYTTVVDGGKETPWMKISFEEVQLGASSYILVESLKDGASQKLNTNNFNKWNRSTAYFNGDKMRLSLFVSPQDKDVFFKINKLVKGEFVQNNFAARTICDNADDRLSSDDPAVGRIMPIGCTGWIASNGAHISAGHCFRRDADMLEFNVPPSLPDGTAQMAAPEDQYAINQDCLHVNDNGLGDDWAVFSVSDNPITELQPRLQQGASYAVVQNTNPANITITGFGVDGPPPAFGAGIGTPRNQDNQTQQTHTGPSDGINALTLRYRTDTQGGNSGSPVIDALTNNAIGVHTSGGCNNGGGANRGTSANNNIFWDSIQLCGTNTPIGEITGPEEVCYAQNTTYTITNPENLPVTWERSSNLIIISSNNTSVTVQAASATRGAGEITAIINGRRFPLDIWVGKPTSPSYVSGPSTVRYGSIVKYNGPAVQGATAYKWYLPYPYSSNAQVTVDPLQWGILSGGTARNLRAIVGPKDGYVQFMGTNRCGTGGAKFIRVTVRTNSGVGDIP